jgi:polygalacturonase
MPARRANLALLVHLFASLATAATSAAATSYSVIDYGAVADGRTDCAGAFLSAWAAACAAEGPASVVVPAGEFLVSRARFSGPCRSGAVAVDIAGTVLAPTPYAGVQLWIVFQNVDGVSVNGGKLDGRGQAYWACRRAGGGSSCPAATRVSVFFHSESEE